MFIVGSSLGWTKDYILTAVYPEELNLYIRLVDIEKLETLMFQTQIAANANSKKPQELYDSFKEQRQMAIGDLIQEVDDSFDREGLQRLKNRLAGESQKILIKEKKL